MRGQGTDLFVVSAVLGHSSAAITEDDDGHPVKGQKRAVASPTSAAVFSDGSNVVDLSIDAVSQAARFRRTGAGPHRSAL